MELKVKQEYRKPEITELSSAIITNGTMISKGSAMDESGQLHNMGMTAS